MYEHDFAAAELRAWECALQEQREAEYDLVMAHNAGDRERVRQVWRLVCTLRTRADMLLAEAVRVRCEAPTSDRLTDTRLSFLTSGQSGTP